MFARRSPSWFAFCAVFLLGADLPAAAPSKAPATGLLDLSGKSADPFAAARPGQWLVFVFTRADCPIANRYAPEIQHLAHRYAARGVVFQLVYCDPDETAEAIHKHVAEYGYSGPAFRDPQQKFARRSGVKVTPEAALFRADGTLLYHGRIDDRFADYGKARPEPTQHDLARAIDAALGGQRVPAAGGSAVGCFIEGL
jgi:hypothetical protein